MNLEQFNAELNAPLPDGFAMPAPPETNWGSKQYQAAANVVFLKMGRINREFPNYRPTLSMLESSFARYTRYARRLRSEGK